jgi:hypothetical protein
MSGLGQGYKGFFLPFLPVPLKAGMKGKKVSSLFEGGNYV